MLTSIFADVPAMASSAAALALTASAFTEIKCILRTRKANTKVYALVQTTSTNKNAMTTGARMEMEHAPSPASDVRPRCVDF